MVVGNVFQVFMWLFKFKCESTKIKLRTGKMVQLVNCLAFRYKDLNSDPQILLKVECDGHLQPQCWQSGVQTDRTLR